MFFLTLMIFANASSADLPSRGDLSSAIGDQDDEETHRNLVLKRRQRAFDFNLITTQLGVGMAVCCGTSIIPGGCFFVPLTVSYAITKISDANSQWRGAVNWSAGTGYLAGLSVFSAMLFISNIIGSERLPVGDDMMQTFVLSGFASVGVAAVLGSIAGYYIFAEPKAAFDPGLDGPGYSEPFHQNGGRHLGELIEIDEPQKNIAY